MPKNKAWNKLKFVERNIIKFQKLTKLSLVYNQYGVGNSGSRYFVYEYFPSLKFHNDSIQFDAIKRKNTNISPFVTLEYEDASQEKIEITNLRSDQIMHKIQESIENKKLNQKYIEYFENFKKQQEASFE
eukprot:gene3085-5255_t